MKEHTWERKVEDFNHVGLGISETWFCSVCNACGGPALFTDILKKPPPWFKRPRYIETNKTLYLSLDCDRAIQQIKEHLNATQSSAS